MAESIVEVRLIRNLRYKLSYIKIFETYLESEKNPEVVTLLRSLIEAQQMAIPPVSRYLRHHDVQLQDLELDQRLPNLGRARLLFRASVVVNYIDSRYLDRVPQAAHADHFQRSSPDIHAPGNIFYYHWRVSPLSKKSTLRVNMVLF